MNSLLIKKNHLISHIEKSDDILFYTYYGNIFQNLSVSSPDPVNIVDSSKNNIIFIYLDSLINIILFHYVLQVNVFFSL